MKRQIGTITELPDGRFWARAPRQDDGSRPSMGIWATEEEANNAIAKGLSRVNKREVEKKPVLTFVDLARGVLDEREHNGVRGIEAERHRFARHLATADFANKSVDQIKPQDIAAWLRTMSRKTAADKRGERALSAGTIRRALSLAAVIFDQAGPQERGIIESNPCLGMKVKAKGGDKKTEDPWTWLTLEEQHAITNTPAISGADKRAILFAIGTGLRLGEQFNLELRDVHVDGTNPRITVRFGSKGKPPKNGKVETIPLFGVGLEAARAQVAALRSQPNDFGLLFPAPRGGRRGHKPLGCGRFDGESAYHDRFEETLRRVGITRNVRWHDLRHTCASSLLQGLWGDPWSLDEVRAYLRHSSVTVTQRYAHLGETALKRAAGKVSTNGGAGSSLAAIGDDWSMSPDKFAEILGTTETSPMFALAEALRRLTSEKASANPLITQLATTLAALLEAQR